MSLLTTFLGYSMATVILLGLALTSFVAEFWWIEVVFNRFPVLRDIKARGSADVLEEGFEDEGHAGEKKGFAVWFRREMSDWAEFIRLPIFASKSFIL